jgi:hypothetical protein
MKREARRAQHVAGIAMSNTRPRVKSRVLSSIKDPSKFQVPQAPTPNDIQMRQTIAMIIKQSINQSNK